MVVMMVAFVVMVMLMFVAMVMLMFVVMVMMMFVAFTMRMFMMVVFVYHSHSYYHDAKIHAPPRNRVANHR